MVRCRSGPSTSRRDCSTVRVVEKERNHVNTTRGRALLETEESEERKYKGTLPTEVATSSYVGKANSMYSR